MELLKLLAKHGVSRFDDVKKLLMAPPYSLDIKTDKLLPFYLLHYNKLRSDMTNSVVRECRGVILEKNTNAIVSYGFNRFYSLYDRKPWSQGLDLRFEEKIDGVQIRVSTATNGDLLVSTIKCIDAKKAWVPKHMERSKVDSLNINYSTTIKVDNKFCFRNNSMKQLQNIIQRTTVNNLSSSTDAASLHFSSLSSDDAEYSEYNFSDSSTTSLPAKSTVTETQEKISDNSNCQDFSFYDLFVSLGGLSLPYRGRRTYVFELVHPLIPSVIPAKTAAIFHLATRKIEERVFPELPEECINSNVDCRGFSQNKLPQYVRTFNFKNLKECLMICNCLPWFIEGFVVVDPKRRRMKLKGPAFLAKQELMCCRTPDYAHHHIDLFTVALTLPKDIIEEQNVDEEFQEMKTNTHLGTSLSGRVEMLSKIRKSYYKYEISGTNTLVSWSCLNKILFALRNIIKEWDHAEEFKLGTEEEKLLNLEKIRIRFAAKYLSSIVSLAHSKSTSASSGTGKLMTYRFYKRSEFRQELLCYLANIPYKIALADILTADFFGNICSYLSHELSVSNLDLPVDEYLIRLSLAKSPISNRHLYLILNEIYKSHH